MYGTKERSKDNIVYNIRSRFEEKQKLLVITSIFDDYFITVYNIRMIYCISNMFIFKIIMDREPLGYEITLSLIQLSVPFNKL